MSAAGRALDGRVAAITGATGAIGGAIAEALAAQGADCCLTGRRATRLETLAARLRQSAVRAVAHVGDLEEADEPERLRACVERELGRLDVLVHAAGAFAHGPHASAPAEDLDRLYRVNARAPYRLTQALLPLLRASRGQVVFVNSTVGLEARPEVGPYAASKHALRAIADALRAEVNADGIRVLSLFLGRTASAMQAEVHEREGRPYRPDELLQPGDVAAMVTAALLLPRTAEVTDIRMRPLQKPT